MKGGILNLADQVFIGKVKIGHFSSYTFFFILSFFLSITHLSLWTVFLTALLGTTKEQIGRKGVGK